MIYTNTAIYTPPAGGGGGGTPLIDDVGQDAVIAVSFRKLRSAYTGDCIQVKRTNDNATQDIGFDANGDLDIAAISSFCGVSDGRVNIWYDQSGNSNNFVQDSVSGGQLPTIYSGSLGSVVQDGGGLGHVMAQSNLDAAMLSNNTGASIFAPTFTAFMEQLGKGSLYLDWAERSNGYSMGTYKVQSESDTLAIVGSSGNAPVDARMVGIETDTSGDPFMTSLKFGVDGVGRWEAYSHLNLVQSNVVTFSQASGAYNAPSCNQMMLFSYPAGALRSKVRFGEFVWWDVTAGLSTSEYNTLFTNMSSYYGISYP
jgi:hypothetical protein